MKRTRMHRRTWLRSSVGAMLPLPFLNLMSPLSAREPVRSRPPQRFVALFKPNGVHPPSWNINAGKEYDFRLSPLMKPFEKHKADVLVLDNMGDFGFSAHKHATRRFMSGHHENSKSASLDQLIADKLSPGTVHRSLELTTEGLFPNQIGCSYISYDQHGDPIPRESDPQLVFDRLFRSPLSDAGKRDEMISVLDRVREDARSLERRAGAEDRQVLEQYFTVLRETEQRLQTMQVRPLPMDANQLQRPMVGGTLDQQVNAMLDLVALALWTDSTRCASYMLGNDNSRLIFDFLGIQEQHHYLSHFFRNFSRQNLDALLKISLWHMEKFDYLLTRLKSYKDEQGTLLEHSIVLFGAGMGHSDNHTATRIPTVLAGQGGGVLKTGRYVRFAKNQELSNLHLALLQKFGVEQEQFAGTSIALPGLDDSNYDAYQERQFDSWVKLESNQVTLQGRLRMSDNLDEAKIFYVDIDGRPPVRLEIDFDDFHHFNVAYYCGLAVKLRGDGQDSTGQIRITKIRQLESVFGEKASDAPG